MGALKVLGAMLLGLFTPGRVTQGELVPGEGPDKAHFKDLHEKEEQGLVPCPEGYQDPALEPVLGKGSVDEHLVAGPVSMGSGWAQPKKGNMGPSSYGPMTHKRSH